MMRKMALMMAMGVVLSTLTGADEPAYTVKIKGFPAVKQPVLCHDTDKQTGVVRFLNPAGKVVQEKKLDEQSDETYTLTVLEAGERAPKRYRQNYAKATSSLVKNNVRSYQGVDVEFLLEKDGYRIGLPAKHSVTEEDQETLRINANNDLEVALDQVFVPPQPIKLGESWKVDPQLLRRAFAGYGVIDPENTKGTGQLVRVYDNQGIRFAVLTVNLTIAFSMMDRLKYNPPALFQIKGELNTDITGAYNIGALTIRSTLEGKTSIHRQDVDLTLEIKREGEVKKLRTGNK